MRSTVRHFRVGAENLSVSLVRRVERRVTYFAMCMDESSWHSTVLEASNPARKHYSGVTRQAQPLPAPHLHGPTCIDSARTFHHQQKDHFSQQLPNLSSQGCGLLDHSSVL
jgi:hypothetical protein